MADWPYNTQAWQRLRRLKLASTPLCEGCAEMGLIRPANTVDHRVAISDGGAALPSLDGLAAYCPSCHSAKTARGIEAGAVHTRKPRKGCNPDGSPLDPKHPWHSASNSNGKQPKKSLRADASRPRGDTKIELVSSGSGQSPGRRWA
ncbi:MAG: HNH endonuclease [Sphingomonadales bacterium]|nr:HNH endonuclease [Sphingomonadales bacterium]